MKTNSYKINSKHYRANIEGWHKAGCDSTNTVLFKFDFNAHECLLKLIPIFDNENFNIIFYAISEGFEQLTKDAYLTFVDVSFSSTEVSKNEAFDFLMAIFDKSNFDIPSGIQQSLF